MNSDGMLDGYRAVVIGGSKGIGKTIAKALRREGASIAVGARGAEALESVKEQLDDGLCEVYVAPCDVRDPLQVEKFIADAAVAMGGVDILVNCASSFAVEDSEAGWAAAFETDLMGAVRGVHAALPHLVDSDHPSVINTSSVSARMAHPDRLPYGAMKAALEQYTASAALLYASMGVRVNCVVIGSTEFPGSIWDRVRHSDPSFYEATKSAIPLGNFAKPENAADLVTFLASPRSSWITGQCLVVDGGQTVGRRQQLAAIQSRVARLAPAARG